MGFLPDIEKIVAMLPKRRQTLMFSATFPKEVESLARRFQRQPKMVQIGKRANPADTVAQCVYEVPAHLRSALLLELLRAPGHDRVLVFVRMKDGANRLADFLQLSGVKVARLHSSRSQEQRIKALDDFKSGAVRVLVATDIVARGIDIDGVTHVVNFDFPVNPEDYIHRIGRTGRAGAQGEAVSLVPEHDLNLLGMVEFAIGRRLQRKKLKHFDYRAPIPRPIPGEAPPRRDWRKRTREIGVAKKRPPVKQSKSMGKPPRKAAKKKR
jgi:ATP-dependent RNA helicase RhlE